MHNLIFRNTALCFIILNLFGHSLYAESHISIPVDPDQNVKAFECRININYSCTTANDDGESFTNRYVSKASNYENSKPLQYSVINALSVDDAFKLCKDNELKLLSQLSSDCYKNKNVIEKPIITTSVSFERLIPWNWSCFGAYENMIHHTEKYTTLAYSERDALRFVKKNYPEQDKLSPFFGCNKSRTKPILIFERNTKLRNEFEKYFEKNPHWIFNVAVYQFFAKVLSQPSTGIE